MLPRRGHIGIFNRSYYEEVLVVRVHPEILAAQHLPPELVGKRIWDERYRDIINFERYLTRQGVVIRKFFLHVSRRSRRNASSSGSRSRRSTGSSRSATSTSASISTTTCAPTRTRFGRRLRPSAPWYVVPADRKWFTRLIVASAIIETLESLRPAFPNVDATKLRELRAARAALLKG